MESEYGVDLFKGVEARLCCGCWFDGSIVIDVVDDWYARKSAG